MFLLPNPPQFLNQAPPGAQQLTLPDLRNVPHLGHVLVRSIAKEIYDVLSAVLVGILTMSSRSGIFRCDTWREGYRRVAGVETGVHTAGKIDPDEPLNMSFFVDFEFTQSASQSLWLNNAA